MDNDNSNVISTGLFICNPFGCGHGGADIYDVNSWNNMATSDGTPTFTTDGTNMYLGWVGQDAQHHLNMLELADTSHYIGGVVNFTDYTQDHAGLCFYFSGQLYVSFISADTSQALHLATYNPNNPTQLTWASGSPFPDSSPAAPGILPVGGKVYFIWQGSGGNNHIWTDYWDGSWHGHIQQSDTTYWAPSIDGEFLTLNNLEVFTNFTGTNHVVYFDTNAYSY